MTTREKMIVGATVAALLYGGYTLLQGGREKPAGGSGQSTPADLGAFVAQSRAQLAGMRLTAAERAVLDAVRLDWDGEPFAVYAGERAARAEEVDVVPAYHYTGFVQAGDARLAIINGRAYREKEPLADGFGIVDAIAPDRVVLRMGGEDRVKTVMFQNPGVTKE